MCDVQTANDYVYKCTKHQSILDIVDLALK